MVPIMKTVIEDVECNAWYRKTSCYSAINNEYFFEGIFVVDFTEQIVEANTQVELLTLLRPAGQ
jgi:hypothetical protein